ncbi:MAG TPA: hypothetical protein VIC25_06730 [Caulobacteraceae bacterium]|jgi:hypothetical protein
MAEMRAWKGVKWTEARQVAAPLDWRVERIGQPEVAPETCFANLRANGRLVDAALFLGQALPRFETAVWAVRMVRELQGAEQPAPADEEAMKTALLWVQDPSEARRRAAFAAAQRIRGSSPTKFAALAVYYSGGSAAAEGAPASPAPPDTAGKFAAAAVIAAAVGGKDFEHRLSTALDAGERIAAAGVGARVDI